MPFSHARDSLSGSASVFSALVWFSIVYAPVTVLVASRKQFWNDELFTFYIARLGSLQRIWDALPSAGDQNPPLFYWLSHVASNMWPDPLISTRLPEILGFWLMGACLIAFVSRHLTPLYGLVAALITLVSGAYPYAYLARPYGLMLGFTALALLCWQRSGEARASMWTAGLAVALALAVSVHYYSVLVFLPLAAAEFVRWFLEGRPRWTVMAAMASGALPIAAYFPLIRSASAFSRSFWAKPQAGSLADFYGVLLLPALLPVSAAAFCAGAWFFIRRRSRGAAQTRMPAPLTEIIAAAVFMLIPAVALAAALVTRAYTHRYALPAVIGCSVLGAWAISRVFRALPSFAFITAMLLSLFFVARHMITMRWKADAAHQEVISLLERHAADGHDLVIADPHLFFEMSHQAPALRPRMLYIAEPELALKHVGTDAVDRSLIGISGLAPLQVKTLADVTAAGKPFLIYGYPAPNGWAWLVQELASLRVPMSVAGAVKGRLLLLVSGPGASRPTLMNPVGRDFR